MAQLDNAFDSSQHEDMTGFDPLPKGKYLCKVVETEIKDTSSKTGQYIKIKIEVLKGDYKGRFLWTNINIVNPNPVAVEIAQKELATLCRAIGKNVIQDTNELHNIPFIADVGIKPAKGDYPAGNKINGYLPVKGQTTTQTTQTTQGNNSPGWDDDDLPF